MEADPAELGGEGIIYQNELLAAYRPQKDSQDSLCHVLQPSSQEEDKWSFQRYSNERRDRSSSNVDQKGKTATDYFRCIEFVPVQHGPDGEAQIARHLQAGIALSDLYCKNYFSRIAQHSRKRGFARTTANDVGTAMSAILGLASAGVGATSGVGVAFGLADGAFRNYDESFLVGPDLAAVQKAVFSEQDTIKKAIFAKPPTNFADANMAIKQHADACSYIGMKLLINEKVTSGATDSREAFVNYLADFEIKQEDIKAVVEAKRKAAAEADKKEAEAKAAEEAARKKADAAAAAAAAATPPVLTPASDTPHS